MAAADSAVTASACADVGGGGRAARTAWLVGLAVLAASCQATRDTSSPAATAPDLVQIARPEISGTVCEDLDRDSVCGPADRGVGGIEVMAWPYDTSGRRECVLGLYARDFESGTVEAQSTLTAADGRFAFPQLPAGRYCLGHKGGVSRGYALSTPSVGSPSALGPLDIAADRGVSGISFAFLVPQ